MPKYVIERNIPGAGSLSAAELEGIATKSNDVLLSLGGDVQWIHSYVTADSLFCVYIAANPDRIREHARRGGFPVEDIAEVATMIDPTTAEVRVAA